MALVQGNKQSDFARNLYALTYSLSVALDFVHWLEEIRSNQVHKRGTATQSTWLQWTMSGDQEQSYDRKPVPKQRLEYCVSMFYQQH